MSTTATASAPYSEPVAHPSTITWMKRSTAVSSQPQVRAADPLVRLDLLGGAGHHDPAGLQHVRVVGELEDEVGVLLDQQERHALLAGDLHEDREQLPGELGCEAQRRLVEQHEARAQHQGAGDREHLLLAAAERARMLVVPLLQPR